MKFPEMPYKRPDIPVLKAKAFQLAGRLTTASTFDEADAIFMQIEEITGNIYTQESLAYVRHCIDTADAFYDEEIEFLNNALPQMEEPNQACLTALMNSPFRAQFEEKYGKLLFVNAEMKLKTFAPQIVPELQQENKLATQYEKLIASAQIPFEGETYTLSQLSPFKQDPDDARRLAAWKAEGEFYRQNGTRLDEIYHELVQIRNNMAKKLGYDNYIELGYYRMTRNSYTAGDVERFRAAVTKYLVPVADRLYREQAERIGAQYPLSFADAALTFRSGNPVPKGDPDAILEHGRKFYHELSQETAEFIDFMYRNDLLDVLSRKGKAGGGFCTTFPDYKAPFIFANFNGTSHDVEVMTHEAGHAFAAYTARDVVPQDNQSPTLESCEVHSMSMEFFAWPWQEGFFGSDASKFYYSHLSGALTFIPYGTMVDHYQHRVYEKPDMTPGERHQVWQELLAVYMPWMKLGGEIPFYGEGKGWQRQSHIYQRPFYYIDYCLAQTVALQFWAVMQQDSKDAWNRYMRLIRLAGTKTFNGLVEAANLATPFGDTALKDVSEAAVAWLNNTDTTALK